MSSDYSNWLEREIYSSESLTSTQKKECYTFAKEVILSTLHRGTHGTGSREDKEREETIKVFGILFTSLETIRNQKNKILNEENLENIFVHFGGTLKNLEKTLEILKIILKNLPKNLLLQRGGKGLTYLLLGLFKDQQNEEIQVSKKVQKERELSAEGMRARVDENRKKKGKGKGNRSNREEDVMETEVRSVANENLRERHKVFEKQVNKCYDLLLDCLTLILKDTSSKRNQNTANISWEDWEKLIFFFFLQNAVSLRTSGASPTQENSLTLSGVLISPIISNVSFSRIRKHSLKSLQLLFTQSSPLFFYLSLPHFQTFCSFLITSSQSSYFNISSSSLSSSISLSHLKTSINQLPFLFELIRTVASILCLHELNNSSEELQPSLMAPSTPRSAVLNASLNPSASLSFLKFRLSHLQSLFSLLYSLLSTLGQNPSLTELAFTTLQSFFDTTSSPSHHLSDISSTENLLSQSNTWYSHYCLIFSKIWKIQPNLSDVSSTNHFASLLTKLSRAFSYVIFNLDLILPTFDSKSNKDSNQSENLDEIFVKIRFYQKEVFIKYFETLLKHFGTEKSNQLAKNTTECLVDFISGSFIPWNYEHQLLKTFQIENIKENTTEMEDIEDNDQGKEKNESINEKVSFFRKVEEYLMSGLSYGLYLPFRSNFLIHLIPSFFKSLSPFLNFLLKKNLDIFQSNNKSVSLNDSSNVQENETDKTTSKKKKKGTTPLTSPNKGKNSPLKQQQQQQQQQQQSTISIEIQKVFGWKLLLKVDTLREIEDIQFQAHQSKSNPDSLAPYTHEEKEQKGGRGGRGNRSGSSQQNPIIARIEMFENTLSHAVSSYPIHLFNAILPLNLNLFSKKILSPAPTSVPPLSSSNSPSSLLSHSRQTSREWLLVIYQRNLKRADLTSFIEIFLTAAKEIKNQLTHCQKSNLAYQHKTFSLIYSQIWQIFPNCCICPSDIEISFPRIAQLLGNILMEEKDQRKSICLGLSYLIQRNCFVSQNNDSNKKEGENYSLGFNQKGRKPRRNQSVSSQRNNEPKTEEELKVIEGNKKVMETYAKNYLIILFNIFTSLEENPNQQTTNASSHVNQKLSNQSVFILNCIKQLLSVTPSKILNQDLFASLCQKLNSLNQMISQHREQIKLSTTNPSAVSQITQTLPKNMTLRVSLYDLSIAFVPYLNVENIHLLFNNLVYPVFSSTPSSSSSTTSQSQSIRVVDHKDRKLLKCIYHLLAKICSSHPSFISSKINTLEIILSNTSDRTQNQGPVMKRVNQRNIHNSSVAKGGRLFCIQQILYHFISISKSKLQLPKQNETTKSTSIPSSNIVSFSSPNFTQFRDSKSSKNVPLIPIPSQTTSDNSNTSNNNEDFDFHRMKTFVQNVLPEVMLAIRENNHKTRTLANSVLLKIPILFILSSKLNQSTSTSTNNERDGLKEVMGMMIAGLAAKSSLMICSTIHSLALLLLEYGKKKNYFSLTSETKEEVESDDEEEEEEEEEVEYDDKSEVDIQTENDEDDDWEDVEEFSSDESDDEIKSGTERKNTKEGVLDPEFCFGLLESISLLFQSTHKDIIRSCMFFYKIFIRIYDQIYDRVSNSDSRNQFYVSLMLNNIIRVSELHNNKSIHLKVKIIIERMIKKFSYPFLVDCIQNSNTGSSGSNPQVPLKLTVATPIQDLHKINSQQSLPKVLVNTHKNLLKLQKREKNKLKKERENNSNKKKPTRRDDDDDDDDDDDEELMVMKSSGPGETYILERKGSKRGQEDDNEDEMEGEEEEENEYNSDNEDEESEEEDVLDFLDPGAGRFILLSEPGDKKRKRGNEDREKDVFMSKDGKIVVADSDDEDESGDEEQNEEEDDNEHRLFMELENEQKKNKKMKGKEKEEKMKQKGSSTKSKSSKTSSEFSGRVYESKKSSGDVKLEGKVEPFAYLKLDPSKLNKRKKNSTHQEYKDILKKNKKMQQNRRGNTNKRRRR